MGNAIVCGGSFIQISNITQVWIGEILKPPFPWIVVLIGIAASVALWYFKFEIIGITLSVIIAVYACAKAFKPKRYALNIEMASARVFSFTSTNAKYLQNTYEILQNIVFDGGLAREKIIVNLGSGTIINESSGVSIGGYDARKAQC